MSVLIETSLGDIVIDLLTEERPRCCLNFLKLCKLKMYNFNLFHNIQRNFIIQTGDPDGTGKGGASVFNVLYGEQAKYFECETVPKIKHESRYTVSMVNDGNGYHGSQFLITTANSLDVLDGLHTVFGHVAEGEDVVDILNETFVDESFTPFQDVRIHHTIILHDPFDDPKGLPVPERSPSPPPYVLDSDRLAVGEEVNRLAGRTTEEVIEYLEEKELKANTQMLEIVGDLPDADMKPPENVLFICKLNPVTSSDDLEIIFSRFGPIKSCEVIRDWKTDDSLCYAFVEYDDVKQCEAAYFKMDNVLIDERRIHVDFSQSVSRLYWNRKKRPMKYNENDKNNYQNIKQNNKTEDKGGKEEKGREEKGREDKRRDEKGHKDKRMKLDDGRQEECNKRREDGKEPDRKDGKKEKKKDEEKGERRRDERKEEKGKRTEERREDRKREEEDDRKHDQKDEKRTERREIPRHRDHIRAREDSRMRAGLGREDSRRRDDDRRWRDDRRRESSRDDRRRNRSSERYRREEEKSRSRDKKSGSSDSDSDSPGERKKAKKIKKLEKDILEKKKLVKNSKKKKERSQSPAKGDKKKKSEKERKVRSSSSSSSSSTSSNNSD